MTITGSVYQYIIGFPIGQGSSPRSNLARGAQRDIQLLGTGVHLLYLFTTKHRIHGHDHLDPLFQWEGKTVLLTTAYYYFNPHNLVFRRDSWRNQALTGIVVGTTCDSTTILGRLGRVVIWDRTNTWALIGKFIAEMLHQHGHICWPCTG